MAGTPCRRCLTEGRRSSGSTPASTCGGTSRWPSCCAGSGPGGPWTLAGVALTLSDSEHLMSGCSPSTRQLCSWKPYALTPFPAKCCCQCPAMVTTVVALSMAVKQQADLRWCNYYRLNMAWHLPVPWGSSKNASLKVKAYCRARCTVADVNDNVNLTFVHGTHLHRHGGQAMDTCAHGIALSKVTEGSNRLWVHSVL